MRSLSRHLRPLTLSVVLLGMVGVLASTIGGTLGATTACGCGSPPPPEFKSAAGYALKFKGSNSSEQGFILNELVAARSRSLVVCKKSEFTGTLGAPSKTVKLVQKYKECRNELGATGEKKYVR